MTSTATSADRMTDKTHQRLREMILSGELAAGAHLSVPSLGRMLDVSRSPVREAVQRLVSEGLAVERPRVGAFVASLSDEEIRQLYEVRELLDGLAARRAAEHATLRDTKRLRALHAAHLNAVAEGDFARHIQLDGDFHAEVRRIADHDFLSETLGRLGGLITAAMLAADVESWPKKAVAEHGVILNAIERRDALAAEDAARTHIKRVMSDLRQRQDALGEGIRRT